MGTYVALPFWSHTVIYKPILCPGSLSTPLLLQCPPSISDPSQTGQRPLPPALPPQASALLHVDVVNLDTHHLCFRPILLPRTVPVGPYPLLPSAVTTFRFTSISPKLTKTQTSTSLQGITCPASIRLPQQAMNSWPSSPLHLPSISAQVPQAVTSREKKGPSLPKQERKSSVSASK